MEKVGDKVDVPYVDRTSYAPHNIDGVLVSGPLPNGTMALTFYIESSVHPDELFEVAQKDGDSLALKRLDVSRVSEPRRDIVSRVHLKPALARELIGLIADRLPDASVIDGTDEKA